MQILRQLDVHPKVREEADILVRTFSGAVGKVFDLSNIPLIGFIVILIYNKLFNDFVDFIRLS